MTAPCLVLTGFGSVSPFGPHRGLLRAPSVDWQTVDRWPTRGPRRARLVPRFRVTDVVPGLNTRRLDRLSVWALVAASLALEDARFEGGSGVDRDRAAVILGTVFGCLDATEQLLLSIVRNGPAMADPILFPETLGNLPAGHVARRFGFRGPNVTLSCGGLTGEAAMAEATTTILCGEAEFAVVMAGDVLTRTLFEWYEAAGLLASECFDAPRRSAREDAFVPGEGLGAVVIETADSAAARGVTPYAQLHSLRLEAASDGYVSDAARGVTVGLPMDPALEGIDPARVQVAARMRRAAGHVRPRPRGARQAIEETAADAPTVSGTIGEFWSGGIVGLALVLGQLPSGTSGLVLDVSTDPKGAQAILALFLDEGSRR